MLDKSLSISLPINLPISLSNLIFIGLSVLSFSISFSLGQPQWLIGTAVNACLFLAIIFLPKKSILPLIILPSLGVLSRGMIFGSFTIFLAYFLPFIWLSNFILIKVFEKLLSRLSYFSAVLIAATSKFLFLITVANICFNFSLVTKVFLQLMGINQFLTALAGGVISWLILNFYAKNNS